MEEKIVTFSSFYDPILAKIIQARLEANGIPCFLADENIATINPLYNQAVGGVKLKVFEKDVEKCKAILEEDVSLNSEAEIGGPDTLKCPNCGSSDVGYGNATNKRFNWLVVILSVFLSVFPFYNKKIWHCYNCGKEFR